MANRQNIIVFLFHQQHAKSGIINQIDNFTLNINKLALAYLTYLLKQHKTHKILQKNNTLFEKKHLK